jgi:lipopolysaccharide export system permease protein
LLYLQLSAARSVKKLHKFIVRSYLGPFVLTLFISIFILLMQWLWKYLDDLVGKGLDLNVIGELLFYASATLIPMALPLAILLSSIMTFGNLGEHYELVSMKSAGLSLWRIMSPLIVTTLIISGIAFYFSNNVLPHINLKIGSLLYSVREQKPALQIKEGVFYNGIEGYSIRVGRKDKDGRSIYNIMIYDHTQYRGNNILITAKEGTMQMSADKKYLILTLKDGYKYEEKLENSLDVMKPHPLTRIHFREQEVVFDLSGFNLERMDEDLFKNNYQMLTLKQLTHAIDSLSSKSTRKHEEITLQVYNNYLGKAKNAIQEADSLGIKTADQNPVFKMKPDQQLRVLETAANLTRAAQANLQGSIEELRVNDEVITRHEVEWHRKFTLSFACIVLFFIGAPLGAIIRKGGLGMPVVVSVIFFIFFHVLSITGEKFAKEGVLPAWQGMWMASAVLLPLGIFLTWKATADSTLFNIDSYLQPIRRLFIKTGTEQPPQKT